MRGTAARRWATAVTTGGLLVALGGCAALTGCPGPPGAAPGWPPVAPGAARPGSAAAPSAGVVAEAESSEEAFQARGIRLVRSGPDELAVQFELHNGSAAASSPSAWTDPRARRLLLFDLLKGTGYQVLTESGDPGYRGRWGRVSASWADQVGPGASITLTAVFAAPPGDTRSMIVALGDLLPVEVPVEPAGSPDLRPDPVLREHHTIPNLGPLVCASERAGGPTRFRLPADVLFAFDRADLSDAAQTALDALVKQVPATAGTVTVAGHTDGLGTDEYNQRLSEQRASSVAQALSGRLGPGFRISSVGFGKTRPIAPNTHPDGTDDPDGRARNRRVEIEVTATGPPAGGSDTATPNPAASGGPPGVAPGLRVAVVSARRTGDYLITLLRISNPAAAPAVLGYVNTATTASARQGLFPGEPRIEDGGNRESLCLPGGKPTTAFSYAASMPSYPSVPAGGSVTLWGLTPAPDTAGAAQVRVGGFADPLPVTIDPGR